MQASSHKGSQHLFPAAAETQHAVPGLSPSAQHVPRPDSWESRCAAPTRCYTGDAQRASRHSETVSRCGGPSTSRAPGAVGRGPPSRRAQACCIHNAAAHFESQYCEYQGLFRPFLFLFSVSNKNTLSLPASEPFFFFLHKTTSCLIASYYTSLWSGGSPGGVA